MQRQVSPSRDDSGDETVEIYRDSNSGSAYLGNSKHLTTLIQDQLGITHFLLLFPAEYKADIIDTLEIENVYDSCLEEYDNKSLASSDEEVDSDGAFLPADVKEDLETDDEELNFSSFFDEEEDTENHEEEASDNLPVHSTITPEYITQWIYDSTYYC